MILAHLTQRKDMPFWEWLWVITLLAGVDANLPLLLGRYGFHDDSTAELDCLLV